MQPLRGNLGPLTLASKAPGNGLLTNLVAYWGLDEAGGANNALDKHTNGLTLTQVSSPGSAAGKVYAGARTFNGSSQWFGRTSETLLQTGAVSFVVAAWVYKTASGARIIASKDNNVTNNREWVFLVSDTAVTFSIFPGGTFTPASVTYSMPLNEWHFVIGWRDQTAGKIYCSVDNGTPTEATAAAATAGTAEFRIGNVAYISTMQWTGRIGPFAYWKGRTLDAAARTALYNAGNGLAYSAFTN